jgi:hypothetical protein
MRLILMLCKAVTWVALDVAKWAAKSEGLESPPAIFADGFISPANAINPWLFSRVLGDMEKQWRENAEATQAELNGCMESLRPEIAHTFQRMMGSLSMKYPMEEAWLRVAANAVQFGMHVERRLNQPGDSDSGERPESPDAQSTGMVAKA